MRVYLPARSRSVGNSALVTVLQSLALSRANSLAPSPGSSALPSAQGAVVDLPMTVDRWYVALCRCIGQLDQYCPDRLVTGGNHELKHRISGRSLPAKRRLNSSLDLAINYYTGDPEWAACHDDVQQYF
jgi:hypothetical protein